MIGSTREKLKTELCSKCHPFYTGQQKLVDTAGRVDKFQAKRMKAEAMQQETAKKASEKKKKPEGYVEKEIPQEVIERAQAQAEKSTGAAAVGATAAAGKWGAPLGKSGVEEIIKEGKAAAKKAKTPKSEKQQAQAKKQVKKPKTAAAAKKTAVKKAPTAATTAKAAAKKAASPKRTPAKKAK